MHPLSFSEEYLQVEHVESKKDCEIVKPTIVFNASDKPLSINNEILAPHGSSLFTKVSIPHAVDVVLMTCAYELSALLRFPKREDIMKNWSHVHDIFSLPHLEHTNLWRSPKEQIGKVAYNLWFAAEGTDCGIHNEHNFLEVHTQIWGTGHMQKFHEKDAATMYQDIYMTPGYTHEPFCKDDHQYPWHRYYADTDCIWLAVEYYD